MRWWLLGLIAGCGRLGFDPQGTGVPFDGAPFDGAPLGDAPPGGDALVTGGGMGSGTITGTPPTGLFPSVMAAYVIGHPSVTGQTGIYLLSKPVACAALGASGWVRSLGAQTNVLEMVLDGAGAAGYLVETTDPPAGGMAYGRDRYAIGNGEIAQGAVGGSVFVAQANTDGSMSGSFTVTFNIGMLSGTFDASYCAVGVEP